MAMMKMRFSNQEQVDAAERELQSVFPKKKIGQWAKDKDERCTYVGITVRDNVDPELIKKLENMGWSKKREIKRETYWNCASRYITVGKVLN